MSNHHTHDAARRRSAGGVLLRLFAIALLVALLPIFALAATVAVTGFIHVEVSDHAEGTHLRLPVPALLADAGLWLLPRLLPEETRDEMDDALADVPELRPALLAVADAVHRGPDGTYLRVRDGRDHVHVQKRRGRFILDVDSPDATVHVAFPARLVPGTVRALGLHRPPRDVQRDDEPPVTDDGSVTLPPPTSL